MKRRLEGKIALVTGGAGGIGSATSHAFAREGAKLALVDIDAAATSEETFDELKQGGGGAIVNTSSIGGVAGAPRQPIYGTTKHAVLGMTKAAAVEYGRKGIRINAVCPGALVLSKKKRIS